MKMHKLSSYVAIALMSCLSFGHTNRALADEPQTGPGFVVNVANDNNDSCTTDDCSLREAITAATSLSGGTITFNIVGDGPHTIALASALPEITNGVNITNTGAGAEAVAVERATGVPDGTLFPYFSIADNATSTIAGLTLRGGRNTDGGAIFVDTGASLTVTDCVLANNTAFSSGGGIFSNSNTTVQRCTFSGNSAARGGGIFHGNGTLTASDSTFSTNRGEGAGGGGLQNSGIALLTNCTFSGNQAGSNAGGGILNQSLSTLTVEHCTLTLNTGASGGGLATQSGAGLTMNNTVIANNTAFMGPDITGPMTAGDYNLIEDPTEATLTGTHNLTGIDPQLGALADNGGPTQTHLPAASSPVINAGDPAFVATGLFDQRGAGFARTSGSRTDLGAVELQGDPNAYPQARNATFDVLAGQTFNGTLFGTDADGDPVAFAITTPPQQGTLTLNDTTTGAFTYVAGSVLGPDSFAYSVTSGGLTANATVSIRITEAPSLIVTATSDGDAPYDNLTSLREAILFANSGQAGASPIITFNLPGAGPHSITIAEELPPVSHDMSIVNEGAGAERVTLDGNVTVEPGPTFPLIEGPGLFSVLENQTLNLRGLTLTRAVMVLDNQGTATVQNCTIVNNISYSALIENSGQLTLINTTLVENYSVFFDAFRNDGGAMTLINCTLHDNSDLVNDNGEPGTLELFNTIVFDSSGISSSGFNINAVSGTYSGEDNIIGTDPGLDPAGLADNGGLVDTIALREDSFAIHAGDSSHLPVGVDTDARGFGFPRVHGPAVDIGAYEARLLGISGYIRTSNLAPIPNASVQLSDSFGAYGAPVATDANGFYTITGVQPGTFLVTPTKAGWTFSPNAQNLTVSNADRGANFVGTRTVATYSISGRIAGVDGKALPGTSVALTPANEGTFNPVLTNSAGYYTFTGVPDGDYTVTPSRTGFTFAPNSHPVKIEGASVSGKNFIGTSGHRISGRIMTSNGIAIPGATVTRTGAGATPVTTNSAGYYTFINVPDGDIVVTPTKSGYIFTPGSKTVPISGADALNQNFIGATGYTVIGRIATSNGTAISGVDVTLDGTVTVQTNSAGYYTFQNVAGGDHTIEPGKSGYLFTPPTRTVNVPNANVSGQNFTGIER